jgi:hypothetical protein
MAAAGKSTNIHGGWHGGACRTHQISTDIGKLERKGLHGRLRHRWDNDITSLKTGLLLNNIHKFSPYLTGNTLNGVRGVISQKMVLSVVYVRYCRDSVGHCRVPIGERMSRTGYEPRPAQPRG